MTALNRISAAVEEEIRSCDPKQNLGRLHFNEILGDVLEKVSSTMPLSNRRPLRKGLSPTRSWQVYERMEYEQRTELNSGDYGLIQKRVRRLTRELLANVSSPMLRFAISDRVVCCIGGDRPWAPGKVQALNEPDPSDPTGQSQFPYVVRIDPPISRLISVPRDSHDVVRPEVCFGQRAGALFFTHMCRPLRVRGDPRRRFVVSERVACAVEDPTNHFTAWVAGTVTGTDLALPEPGEPEQGEPKGDAGTRGANQHSGTRSVEDGDGAPGAPKAPKAPKATKAPKAPKAADGRCCGAGQRSPPPQAEVPYRVRLDTGCDVSRHATRRSLKPCGHTTT